MAVLSVPATFPGDCRRRMEPIGMAGAPPDVCAAPMMLHLPLKAAPSQTSQLCAPSITRLAAVVPQPLAAMSGVSFETTRAVPL